MHPIARCTIPVRMRPLPCRSVPVWTQSHCSAVPPRSEATRCTAVSPRWKAARRLNVPALYGHKLVALLYRFCSHILHCPAASLADHPLTSYPPVWVQPRSPPRCATPFGCAHCLAMPLLLTGSTRCPAIQKSPCCGVPVRIFPAVLPCRMTQRQLHCPRLGTTSFSPLYDPLRMRLTAPLCRRCAEIRLLPDHILCSKAIPLPAVHPWPEISPAAPLCRHAVAAQRGGGSSLPDLFPVPNDPNGSFFFFC